MTKNGHQHEARIPAVAAGAVSAAMPSAAGRWAIAARRTARIGGTALLAFALAGCGFQLRGSPDPALLASGAAGIETRVDAPRSLRNELRISLTQRGFDVGNHGDAALVVRASSARFEERRLTVSAVDARAQENELLLKVVYSARLAEDDASLVERETVFVQRDLLVDSTDIVGRETESRTLRAEMLRNAAARIAEQVAARLSQRG